mgnify:CR=1 FL=1
MSLVSHAQRGAIILAAAALLLVGLVPAAAAAETLAVTTPYPSIAVAPGSDASFELTITNSREGTVGLAVTGAPAGWKATLHGGGFVVTGVTAAPGKPGEARLDVDVPADATATTASAPVTQTMTTPSRSHSSIGQSSKCFSYRSYTSRGTKYDFLPKSPGPAGISTHPAFFAAHDFGNRFLSYQIPPSRAV